MLTVYVSTYAYDLKSFKATTSKEARKIIAQAKQSKDACSVYVDHTTELDGVVTVYAANRVTRGWSVGLKNLPNL